MMTAPTPQHPPQTWNIAIVGAGIAGLACAARLVAAGHRVTMFDKGFRPGGRLATRRSGGGVFDHGAQFITARSQAFVACMLSLQEAGVMAPWPAAARDGDIAWTGVPGMSSLPGALAKHLSAQGVTMHPGRHVAWINEDGSLRHLDAKAAAPGSTHEAGGELSERFDAVLLALPAPQAIPLLAARRHVFADTLAKIVFAPCWAVMASFPTAIAGPDVYRPKSGPLSWIARNSGKPGHPPAPECWMLHASAAWSRAHLERDPARICADLLASFHETTASDATPDHISAHRWRYAFVEQSLGSAFLWDNGARLGICGDGCLGPRVEAAFESGQALAQAVMETT